VENDAPADFTANTTIEPVSFDRPAASRRRIRWLRPGAISLVAVFVLLGLATYFMFSARAVRVLTDPAGADFEITGGFAYLLGERYLILPGEYALTAEHNGFEQLEATLLVGSDADQEHLFSLVKLPGILTVNMFGPNGPVPASITLDEVDEHGTPATIDPISPGTHTFAYSHPRYLAGTQAVDIEGKREHQTIDIQMRPAWAEVSVSSLPEGASIRVDGELRGVTPMTVEVMQGRHELEISRTGFKRWLTNVEVEAGVSASLDDIQLVPSDGRMSITSDPAGANVTVDGMYRGQTPLSLVLDPSKTYPVALAKAGYEENRRDIRVEADDDLSLNITLAPLTGYVTFVVTPGTGEIFVDGKSHGSPSQRLKLVAATHKVEIVTDGFATHTASVTPRDGFEQQFEVALMTIDEARIDAMPKRQLTSLGQEMRLILGGDLSMGAARGEPGRRSNEVVRKVRLIRPFFIGVNEVTNEQFNAFDPLHDSGILGRSMLNDASRPVVNISWNQAAAFCNWLSEKDGLTPTYEVVDGTWRASGDLGDGYRLPTEAEWAFTARLGSEPSTRFPWGDRMPPPKGSGNFADISAANMVPQHVSGYNDSYRGPAPGGIFSPNDFGIYDLAGNAAEWMHDIYTANPSAIVTIDDPTGPPQGTYHVVRGSSFMHGRFSELRWAYRDYGELARADVGFRLARYLPDRPG
jgi:formylglycine-generating enzyme required for sulfatase activity